MQRLQVLASAAVLIIGVLGCEKEAAPPPNPSPSAAPSAPSRAPSGAPVTMPPAPASGAGQIITVAGISFPLSEGWRQVPPANPMRLAEVQVPGSSGNPAESCTIAFSTAGGDVQGNVSRWAAQVRDASGQPSTPSLQSRTVHGLKVHVAEMTGTYSGMNESPRAGWTLRGAIIEAPSGLLFVKMTGPADAMAAAGPGFTALIDGLVP